MTTVTNLKFKPAENQDHESDADPHPGTVNGSGLGTKKKKKSSVLDLGNGSQVVYVPKFLSYQDSWNYFDYLNKNIPWTRPTIRVFGRSCVQPRDMCYVANEGLSDLVYSGYQPRAYSWDEFPPLKDILDAVHKALPGSSFNSLLLNRYKGGSDYVSWHADDEKVYGPTPEIASVSFGCEREFLLKRKPSKNFQVGMMAVSQVNPEQKENYMAQERSKRKDFLQQFLNACSTAKVKVETILIESDLEAKAILDLIPILNITKLVLGTTKANLRKMRSRRGSGLIADQILKGAPEFCDVKIICEGKETPLHILFADYYSPPASPVQNQDQITTTDSFMCGSCFKPKVIS